MPNADRNCNGCTMCCKLLGIVETNTPPGVWCPHCEPAKGCRIYDDRFERCRGFLCGYLLGSLGEEWNPRKCRMVLATPGRGVLTIHVEPDRPNAWRKAPFYAQIQSWVQEATANNSLVMIRIGNRTLALFPDREVDLGIVEPEEDIQWSIRPLPGGRYQCDAVVVRPSAR